MNSGCSLCPRRCGVNRNAGQMGYCGVGGAMICRVAPHFGEEPCISGSRGSGTVFFAGCNLRCAFCQNHQISRGAAGRRITANELTRVFLELRDQGVHNLNLVTADHVVDTVIAALESVPDLGIPVVWNSSGYASVETLRRLDGLVQIYLPDFKYADAALARRYSGAADYPEIALAAVREMYRQTGPAELDETGLLCHGVLLRHLILPGAVENTLRVIDLVEDQLPVHDMLFSLMSQYTPMPGLEAFPELQRPVSAAEYQRCMDYLEFSSIDRGYFQSPDSAGEEMIPEF